MFDEPSFENLVSDRVQVSWAKIKFYCIAFQDNDEKNLAYTSIMKFISWFGINLMIDIALFQWLFSIFTLVDRKFCRALCWQLGIWLQLYWKRTFRLANISTIYNRASLVFRESLWNFAGFFTSNIRESKIRFFKKKFDDFLWEKLGWETVTNNLSWLFNKKFYCWLCCMGHWKSFVHSR